tara:strand:+ start:3447 stop:3773 length:327 start_codon:yes stop_codon:yes gene_type:complete
MTEKTNEKISGSDSMMDVICKLSEGNPGATSVLAMIAKEGGDSAIIMMLTLDDMNMRGPQIWLAYKDHCGEDIGKLAKALFERDPEMVKTVNANFRQRTAVTSGASFR